MYTPTPTEGIMELERSGIPVPQVKKEVFAFYVLAQVLKCDQDKLTNERNRFRSTPHFLSLDCSDEQ